MSSEEEATAANVLSQMSQIQQISACETIDATVVVGHHCDVETTATQENQETTTVEVSSEVLQQVQAAFQHELPQLAAAVGYGAISKSDDVTHTVIHDPHVQVLNDGIQCTTCTKPGKLYTCEHCGKKFNKSYNLKTHIRVHTGERPYQCEVCGHGFANLGDLKRHSRTHTGEKPFKCEFCGKVFSDFGSHKRHLRLHTGYKPFKCDQCEREFTRLDSFKNHLRLHTGDRPYKCDTCKKEFNYLTTYKRHLNIHKGEKPYACTQCEKRFTRQNYLANHMNTHAKIQNQESQTDGAVNSQEDDEEHTSQDSPSKVSTAHLSTDGKSGQQFKGQDFEKSTGSKTTDTSLLQQVTQALGDIIPQNVNTDISDTTGASHIVVQGTGQTGGEFKVTLAQQLLIAQHILNQAQRSGSHGDDDSASSSVTTVSLPEITPELAEQIVSQVSIQTNHNDTGLSQNDAVQVIEVSSDTTATTEEQGLGRLVTQGQIPHQITLQSSQSEVVVDESDVVITTVTGSTQDNAVYVAVDPSQPDVQQLLGEIQVIQSSAQTSDKQT